MNKHPAFHVALLFAVLIAAQSAHAQLSAGDLDPTFGTGGLVTTDFGGSSAGFRAVVVQPDNKLVAAGFTSNGDDVALSRFNVNGTLDTSFGIGGRVTTDLGPDIYGIAEVVRLQADGKIVVTGAMAPSGTPNFAWFLARYDSNGNLDAGFGDGGFVIKQFGSTYETPFDLVIQPDGKIVAAGYAGSSHGDYDFILFRCNANGSLDDGSVDDGTPGDSFGTDSHVRTNLNVSDVAWGLALQSDGKLVVAGRTGGLFQTDAVALVRYNPDGSLDAGFGIGGIELTDLPGRGGVNAIAILPSGEIVVGGNTTINGFNEFALLRYSSTGVLDTGFGTDGLATANVTTGIYGVQSLVIQVDGKIVAAGTTTNGNGTDNFGLVRFNANGSPDSGFGTNGVVVTDFFGGGDQASEVRLQADGRIVVAGYAEFSPGNYDAALARYLPGPLETEIHIDVKPGGEKNRINLISKGQVHVALFGSSTFDVLMVRVNSVRFAGASVVGGSVDDVNGDGFLDLVFHFRIQDTTLKATYGTLLAAADTIDNGRLDRNVSIQQSGQVKLTGTTFTDQEWEGSDNVELFLEGKPLKDFLATLPGI